MVDRYVMGNRRRLRLSRMEKALMSDDQALTLIIVIVIITKVLSTITR